jgi:hypothetical protein
MTRLSKVTGGARNRLDDYLPGSVDKSFGRIGEDVRDVERELS